MDVTPVGSVGVEAKCNSLKDRTEAPPGYLQMPEEFLAGMEVFVESEGKRLPGPNYPFFGEYKDIKGVILRNRLKVGTKGSLVVDADSSGHHHSSKVTEEEKKAVRRHLEGYGFMHETCRILHFCVLRFKGFGTPLENFVFEALKKRGEEAD